MFESEIERMLRDDIREQKRTGNGIHGRTLRLRKHETVRTPSEYLTGIEKKKVFLPSVIRITTIGVIAMEALLEQIKSGIIPPKAEFEALDFDNSQKSVAELRRLHTNSEIMKIWKCSSQSLGDFFQQMQVAKIKGGSVLVGQPAIDHLNKGRVTRGIPKIGERSNQKEKPIRPYNRTTHVSNVSNIVTENIPILKEVKEVDNYLINIKKKFKTEELANFLDRLSKFLSEENQEFLVEIKVIEIGNKK